MSPRRPAESGLGRRLAWFVGIWIASVGALGAVAWLLRAWIG